MLRSLSAILFGLLLAALGLFAGWQLRSGAASAAHEHEDEHHDDHDDDHDDHDDHEDEHPPLSEQTLKTLGVVVEPLHARDFVRSVDVRAVLVDRPENHRSVVTPVGGIVREVHVESGSVVKAGTPLLTLTRDPIPLGASNAVMEIVLPAREVVHEATSALRSAHTDLGIVESELARIDGLRAGRGDDLPDLFASRRVELGYDRERVRRRLDNAEAELHHHGLEPKEIARILEGQDPPPVLELWRRILAEHELWGAHEEKILAHLPEEGRDAPWGIALVAALRMQGLAGSELLAFLEAHPEAAGRFREIAGLLLEGRSIENLAMIAEVGALEPQVVLRTPDGEPAHWDVERLLARVGQRLEAGEATAELYDPRRLWLRLEPIGGEIAHVRRAVREHVSCNASPLLPGSAPELEGVHLRRLASLEDHGTVAYAEIRNELLHEEEGRRSWSLQAGVAYVVHVPLETLAGRFVLPAEAVVRDGPDRIVYVVEEEGHEHDDEHDEHEEDEHHDEAAHDPEEEDHEHEEHEHDDHAHEDHHHFHPVPVHVELEAGDLVVIRADGALHEGEDVVVRGAFALHLALRRGGGEGEAGHGHSHH